MPTIPIVPQTASSVPFAIEPSAVTEAKLIAAYAEWDGTGASGSFLPCLAIYSDAGVRLGRVFPSSSVAAGDKAVVTYAPFPGGIGQKQTAAAVAFATYSATISVLSGGSGPVTPWTYNAGTGETDLFDLTSPGTPAARQAGVYAFSIYATSHSTVADKAFDLEMDVNTADSFFTASDFPLDGSNVHPGPYGSVCSPPWVMAAAATWDAGISHLAGMTITFDVGAYVTKLG